MAMTSDLREAKRFLSGLGGEPPVRVLAAVSGGLDSMCLLHLLSAWGEQNGLAVTAAHFNHRLRETAGRDEAFVREWCAAHRIPFVCGSGDVRAAAEQRGLSIEEAARDLRYAFLEEQRAACGCAFVLTAHHADDHAETMLLHLLRGTGAKGLAGIPAAREGIRRPFLQVTRRELEAYAQKEHIPHVEDETNALDDAARNVLRHKVLPVLRELNPKAVENMTRTAALLSEDEAVLGAMAEDLLKAGRTEPGCAAFLPASAWEGQPPAVVRRALRRMMCAVSGRQKDLSAAHAEAVMGLLSGLCGQEISLPYGMVARREADGIALCRRDRLAQTELKENCPVFWGDYRITLLREARGEGLLLRGGGALSVAPCDAGARLHLTGAKGSRSVKRLCVDRGISLADRARLPAFFVEGRTAAVWPLGTDQAFLPEGNEPFRFVQIQILKDTEEREP